MGDLDISGDRIINREGKILQSDYSRHSDSNGKNRKNRTPAFSLQRANRVLEVKNGSAVDVGLLTTVWMTGRIEGQEHSIGAVSVASRSVPKAGSNYPYSRTRLPLTDSFVSAMLQST